MSEPTYTMEDLQLACEDTVPVETFDAIKDKLTRPKHSFSDGQLVAVGNAMGPYGYQLFENIDSTSQVHRPLTLTEHGDGVKALREAVGKMLIYSTSDDVFGALARDAIAAFDPTLSPENNDA